MSARTAWLVLACSLALAQSSCSPGNPPQPKAPRTVILTTPYDEERAGAEAAEQVAAEMGIVDDPALGSYVEEVGRRLVRYAPGRPFEYRFQILDQSMPNAFALPGGYIYLSRGLLALTGSEDELAGVLGHEIIHAAERHAAARQEVARRNNPFVMPALRMARLAAFGRDQEREADRGGQLLAARAGFDPMGMAEFLKRLGHVERLLTGYSRLPSYFDTHPGTSERVTAIAARAASLDEKRDQAQRADRNAHLARIDGVALSPNPAEGVFRGTRFLHPELDFQIRFPDGWSTVNTRAAVGATSPDGQAHIFLVMAARGSEARRTAEVFVAVHQEGYHARTTDAGPLKVGHLEAYRIEAEAYVGVQRVGVQLTFIPYDGIVYRLTGVAPAHVAAKYLGHARNTARSFRPLTDAERASIEVLRLRVVTALSGEDLAALSRRAGNVWDEQRTAVLNGLFADVRFAGGESVKIVRAEPYHVARPPAGS